MSDDWDSIAKGWWDEQPHPRDPTGKLKIGEYATAVKLATMAKFGGHASPHEATLFWDEFKASGMHPEEFEQTLDKIAPLSFTYHGRPPTMKELTQLKDKQPHEQSKYFSDLPDKHYPSVTAGNMVKTLAAARPHAQENLNRDPVKLEAAYLHHSGTDPADYYSKLGAQAKQAEPTIPSENGLPPEVGGNPGGRGAGAAR
jgi:hypothetical protein